MKSVKISVMIAFAILMMGTSSKILSQSCGSFVSLTNGTSWEMTNYNSKGVVEGTSVSQVTKSVTADEGTVATVQTTSKDAKGTSQGTVAAAFKCVGGTTYIEMRNFIPAQSFAEMKNMSIKTDGTWIEFPQTLTSGITLKASSGTMTLYNGSTLFATVKIDISNRKVVGTESVTTTAGTFTCFKITQDITVTTTAMGMTMPATTTKSVDYLSAGTGIVKSEAYDKDNKISGYSLLTKITKL